MIDDLLNRLEKVRRTGPDRWIACCSAHDDRSPSLAIRETDDGRILLHCFAGCPVDDVLAAVGLDMSALFPDRPVGHRKPERQPFPAADLLRCLARETTVAMLAAESLLAGPLGEADHVRLRLAYERICGAADLLDTRPKTVYDRKTEKIMTGHEAGIEAVEKALDRRYCHG